MVAKRLLHYIAAGLLSPADLAKHRDVWLDGKKESLRAGQTGCQTDYHKE